MTNFECGNFAPGFCWCHGDCNYSRPYIQVGRGGIAHEHIGRWSTFVASDAFRRLIPIDVTIGYASEFGSRIFYASKAERQAVRAGLSRARAAFWRSEIDAGRENIVVILGKGGRLVWGTDEWEAFVRRRLAEFSDQRIAVTLGDPIDIVQKDEVLVTNQACAGRILQEIEFAWFEFKHKVPGFGSQGSFGVPSEMRLWSFALEALREAVEFDDDATREACKRIFAVRYSQLHNNSHPSIPDEDDVEGFVAAAKEWRKEATKWSTALRSPLPPPR